MPALGWPERRRVLSCVAWQRCVVRWCRNITHVPSNKVPLSLRHIAGTAWSTKYLNIELLKDQMRGAVTA